MRLSFIKAVKNQVEKSAAAIVKTNSSAKKLTPLEQQVKALKEKYQDTLLMVECGKKNLEPTKIKDFFFNIFVFVLQVIDIGSLAKMQKRPPRF